MSHLSLYRKYRPATFEEVVGQEHVVRTLMNAIEAGTVSHAYLFAGSRGTGKTSTAKLLAKALNCAEGPTPRPCGKCDSCLAIGAGASLDVIEMDAASNRGIDDIRDIRDKVAFATVEGKYKVYILDEAHMLTKEASNAFLKVLEEPPAHVIFVLCTTEAHKVIPTIQSRCQKFEFRRPDAGMVLSVLERITAAEGIVIDPAGLAAIARSSAGAFRDAIGALDQLATYSGKEISLADVLAMLGTVESDLLFEAVDIVAEEDVRGAILFINRLAERGRDLGQFAQELVAHLRNIFLLQQLDDYPDGVIDAPAEDLARLEGQARLLNPVQTLRFIELLAKALAEMKRGSDPRLQLELAFIVITRPETDRSTKSLLYRLEQLEARGVAAATTKTARPAGRQDTGRPGQERPVAPPDQPVASRPAAPQEQPGAERPPMAGGAPAAVAVDDQPAAAETKPAPAPETDMGTSGETQPAVSAEAEPEYAGEAETQTGLSLDRIARAWAVILQQVRHRDAPLHSLLKESRPVELEGNLLVIGFPHGAEFEKNQAGKPKNRALIEEVLGEIAGAGLKAQLVIMQGGRVAEEERPSRPGPEEIIAMIKDELEAEEIP